MRLASLAPEIVGDPRRSVFRIYRDVRFSKDKSPYKTHAACWFYHRDASHRVGQESHGGGGGFYFQIAPGDSFTGGGIWMPPREALAKLRDAMAEKPAAFERTVTAPAVRRRLGALDDEAVLTRVPRGYAPDHKAARWLRYKSFTLGRALTDAQATGPQAPRSPGAGLRADAAAGPLDQRRARLEERGAPLTPRCFRIARTSRRSK